jgi:hypothetical protein
MHPHQIDSAELLVMLGFVLVITMVGPKVRLAVGLLFIVVGVFLGCAPHQEPVTKQQVKVIT